MGGGLVKRLWILMTTVFVDMIGFAIVLPLLPFYALRYGADPFMVGVLIAAFPFAQLVTSPLWGRLSDRYGRRPMILTGLSASAVAFTVFGLADSVLVLLVSRLVQGAGGGTTAVVQAYVSDSVDPEDRAAALGWITSASSAGVMLGPAIGSLAATLGPEAPGFIAAGLCVLNVTFAWFWLPESTGAEGRQESAALPRRSARRVMKTVLTRPRERVSTLVWIYSFGMMAFMAMNGVLALFLEHRFGVTEKTIGWFYVYVGALSVIIRSVLLGPAVRRFGEERVMTTGAFAMAVGLAAIPLSHSLPMFALAVLLLPLGTALLFPATTSLASRSVPTPEVGMTLGVKQTFGGVSRLLGPVWAGAAFQQLGVAEPFFIAAGIMALVALATRSLRPRPKPPPSEEIEAAEAAEPTLPT